MKIETTTIISEKDVGGNSHALSIEVRHDNDYMYGFHITLGCHTLGFTSDDLRLMVKCFNKALRVRKAAAK